MSGSRNKHIEWDLVKTPIQIKTSSTLGSGNLIGIDMFTANKSYIGGIGIKLDDNGLKYWLDECNSYTDFPVQPTNEVDKIWTFTITETAVIINCNGVELLNYQFEDSNENTCKNWVEKECKYIVFLSNYNTASEFYRAKPLMKSGNRLKNNQVLLTSQLFSFNY